MEKNIEFMLKQLNKCKTERDRQLGLFNWIRTGVITFKEYQELVKYLFIPVVIVPKGTLSCISCKGTDLRRKDKNYYVCNTCGQTQTT